MTETAYNDIKSQFHNHTLDDLILNVDVLNWQNVSSNYNINWTCEIIEKFENKIDWHELIFNQAIDWKDPAILVLAYRHNIFWEVINRTKWSSEDYFKLKLKTELQQDWGGVQRDFLSFDINWKLKEFINEFDSFRLDVGPEENGCYGSQTFFEMYKSRLNAVFENFWLNNSYSNVQLFYEIENFHNDGPNDIGSFYTQMKWESLSKSKVIPWSLEIIEKYQDRWHWLYLLKNPKIDWIIIDIQKYQNHIRNFIWQNDFGNDVYPNAWNGLITNSNLKIPLEEIAKTGFPNWKYLPLNSGINFTLDFLEYLESVLIPMIQLRYGNDGFQDYNDIKRSIFMNLHKSNSITWSYEILYKHKDDLNWNESVPQEGSMEFNCNTLSFIKELFYTEKFIDDFSDVIDFKKLSKSEKVEWSNQLLTKYKNSWNSSYLKKNKAIQWNNELDILFPKKNDVVQGNNFDEMFEM